MEHLARQPPGCISPCRAAHYRGMPPSHLRSAAFPQMKLHCRDELAVAPWHLVGAIFREYLTTGSTADSSWIVAGTDCMSVCSLVPQVTPLRQLENCPVLSYEPVSCRTCPGVLNPYCRVDFGAHAWFCPMWCGAGGGGGGGGTAIHSLDRASAIGIVFRVYKSASPTLRNSSQETSSQTCQGHLCFLASPRCV